MGWDAQAQDRMVTRIPCPTVEMLGHRMEWSPASFTPGWDAWALGRTLAHGTGRWSVSLALEWDVKVRGGMLGHQMRYLPTSFVAGQDGPRCGSWRRGGGAEPVIPTPRSACRVPVRSLHLRHQLHPQLVGPGGESLRGLFRLRLRGLDQGQPPPRRPLALGHLQQPLGAQPGHHEASAR